MRKFNVEGMSCAACSARVERAVSALDGVESCSVSLLTNSMGVVGNASDEEIIAAVEAAGYGASLQKPEGKAHGEGGAALSKKNGDTAPSEIAALRGRLISSAVFLLILMYISMGYVMWGFPMPAFFDYNPIAVGLCEMILSATVMVINQKFFISGFRAILHRAPNMDTLVALGSGASFLYSVYSLFMMTDAAFKSGIGIEASRHYLHGFYFESASMILTLITVGKLLESIAKGRTTSALKGLMDLAPKTATLLRDGEEICVAAEQVVKGDVFAVCPGDRIPVDGVIIEGNAAIDESALTGESLPVDKSAGDRVSAGTINSSGYIVCEAVRVGEDTTLSQIIAIVSDASATKAPIAKAADRVSGIFVPAVLAVAAITAVVWAIVGADVDDVFSRAIAVLVISCPCALGLATPVAVMVGNGVGAKKGILFKTAESLEMTGKAKIAVLDKTGTVTKGEMTVTELIPSEGVSEAELARIALALEKHSEHPLARAIVIHCEAQGMVAEAVSDFKADAGLGVRCVLDESVIAGGNMSYIASFCEIPKSALIRSEKLAEEGKTPMFFTCGGKYIGMMAVSDTIKDDSKDAIRELKNMGLCVVMLTGDNKKTAASIGRAAEVDEVIAEVLPDGKAEIIGSLKKQGKVIMVGDGINDAPALAVADVGIAIGAGADVAIDAADVVLVKSKLSDLVRAIKISKHTLRNIHQNLFWAFFYNAMGIPLAAGVWIPLLGLELSPMFGALAMSLSSFCVVSNALRLNLINTEKPARAKHKNDIIPTVVEEKGEITMKKTMKIEGMMCPHCSGRVNKCLEALDCVESAEVSHESGCAIVSLASAADDSLLKKTVEDQGYTVLGIE